jgi:hypothetical protein
MLTVFCGNPAKKKVEWLMDLQLINGTGTYYYANKLHSDKTHGQTFD